MQIVSPNTGSSLFGTGGVFGQASQGNSGLFGLLMTIFNQNGGQLTTGQILPTGTPTQASSTPQLVPNLPLVDTGAEVKADPAAQLLAMLQGLSQQPNLSPELKALLGDGKFDLSELQQRFAALDEDTRTELMSEIAGLLQMPMQAALPPDAPVVLNTEGEKVQAPVGEASAPAPTKPTAETAHPVPMPVDAAPEVATEAAPEVAVETAVKASPEVVPVTQPTKATKPAPVKAAAEVKVDETGKAIPQEMAAVVEPIRIRGPQKDVVEAKPAQETVTQSVQAAVAKPAEAPAPVQNVTRPTTAQPTAIKPLGEAKADGGSTGGDTASNLLKDTLQPAAPQTAQQTDKSAPAFVDHLSQVKLNRTGAHIPVSDQVAVQMSKAVQNGQEKFTVRLNPAELGRIEIKVEMTSDGRVSASFQVDQPATLDLLQKDQRGLERALSDAGLKADPNSLNFNLRNDNPQHRQNAQDGQAQANAEPGFSLDGEMVEEKLPAGILETTWYIGPDRLDVRV